MSLKIRSGACAGVVLAFLLGAALEGQTPMGAMVMAPEPLGISMNRAGSGTTWVPDAVQLPYLQRMKGDWDFMVHGFVFGQYTDQGGPRGDSQFGSLNWGMLMATRELAGGRFQLRTMLSLDPWSVTAKGYPLLLQTGEVYKGSAIVDRQHPHDFLMELAANYERELTQSLGFSLYAGPSGEPALGPVAFMHRPSSMDLPFAPLGHHWQDATHITFGVVTAGLFGRKWKLEGSAFNGREPNDERWDVDAIKLDSYSGRLTVNPTANWSASLGYGWLKSPESLEPAESITRLTGSIMHGARIGNEGQVATSLVVGVNSHHGDFSAAYLVESEAVLNAPHTIFGRAERVARSPTELGILPPSTGSSDFDVGAYTVGYVREAFRIRGGTIGLGGFATANRVPSAVATAYGSKTPISGTVFLRVRPAFGKSRGMAGMHH